MPAASPLTTAFAARWKGAAPAPPEPLEALLSDALAQGSAKWPGVDLPGEAFAEYVGDRAPEAPSAEAALRSLCLEDLYLACACARGSSQALRLFEERQLAAIPSYLKRFSPTPAFVDEVRQLLREKLFVGGPDRAPKILAYGGRGALAAWLRIVSGRIALEALPRTESPAPAQSDEHRYAADPELAIIRARCKGEFEVAFREALATLTPKERNLLRLHVRDGVPMGRIGAVYRTHRTTVLRWLAAAQEKLVLAMRQRLSEKLRLTATECQSMLQLLQSRASPTLQRLLADDEDPPR